jgi:dihydrofolate reductase
VRADRLYITEIQKEFSSDTWFPEINQEQWQVVSREDINNDSSVDFNYSFMVYMSVQLVNALSISLKTRQPGCR